MKKLKVGLIIFTLFTGLIFPNISNVYATGNSDNLSSYELIHYNGGEQQITVNEDVTLKLTGWTDDTKTSVNGVVSITSGTTVTKNITLSVNEKRNELSITDQLSYFYRIVAADSFKVLHVKSQNFTEQSKTIIVNENGTSVEQLGTIDEYGTVITDLGLKYYKTDESNQKVEITEAEYNKLNATTVTSSSEGTSSVKEQGLNETGEKATSSVQVEANSSSTNIASTVPSVSYTTHVQDYGWLKNVKNGQLSGTTGESKRLEAIKISLENVSGGISYRTHVQDYGWLPFVKNGELSGTTGESKRLEAIQISLTGGLENSYDIYYRVHIQDYGWLGWAKNGQSAGSEGRAKRLEAIQIVLVAKGGQAPGSTTNPFLEKIPSVSYTTHVQDYGWMTSVKDGATGGTTGKNKRLEAIKINLENSPYFGSISYSAHVQDYGWLPTVINGAIGGTTGQNKRLEAIQINLTGDIANYYDIYYRAHVQDYGWLGWAKNGMKAGTQGQNKRMEAIQIKLVKKGQGEAVDESQSFKEAKSIIYQSYNLTLADAVKLQMKVSPQTDKQYAYVDKTYIKDNKVINIEPNSHLNVRSGPGVSYAAIGKLKNGDSVKIIAEVNGWYAIEFKHLTWVTATPADVEYYLNPNNFAEGTTEYFQFLKLSNTANLDANEINTKILNGKGILSGKAGAFITAGKKYNVNEVYLISHALLETGQGNSNLSNGKIKVGQLYYDSKTGAGKWVTFLPSGVIYVAEYKDFDTSDKDTTKTWKYTKESSFDNSQATNIRTIYNMYGIDAVDSAPEIRGSIKAYREGWFDPNTAIIEGAKFIAESYIHAGQDTLYEMRWNPKAMETYNKASHQYASDIGWAVKQTYRIKQIYDQLVNYTLAFDVPKYK